jgi:Toprim domain
MGTRRDFSRRGAPRQGAPRLDSSLSDLGIRLKRIGPGEHRASCPRCTASKVRPGDVSLAVRVEPDGAARWHCHRCSWSGAVRPPGDGPGWRPRRPIERPASPSPDPVTERKRELAQEIWRQSEPIGHPERHRAALAYLAGRKICRWDRDRLLFHPTCPFGREIAPAIVAPVNSFETSMVVGIWRVRLTVDGTKVGRFGLGPTKGCAARLFAAPGPALVVCEGCEDALAAHALFGLPAWSALSAGNMRELILPERFRQVLILADRDEPKEDGRRVGLEAAHELARRLRAEGRAVTVRWARPGLKDANDVVMQGTAA